MIPASTRAPSATLPLAYLGTAAVAFLLAALSLVWLAPELAGHYYQPRLLALVHTVTLGWITLTIMGASYQLIPVVIERAVWSERLAWAQLAVLAAGIVGMVGHFFIGQWSGLVWGAALVTTGVGLHLVNVALTVRGLRRWTFTSELVVLALAGLALTALFGLLLGLDKLWRFLPGTLFGNLHAHVHLGLGGWVLPMVIGVAARVYPMFLLAREPGGWPGAVQLGGLVVGLPLVAGGLVGGEPRAVAMGAVGLGATVAGHLAWVVAVVRSRRRPVLDWGLRFALTGAGFLVPATALGAAFALDVVAGPRLAAAYAVLALGGWASLTIAGMMLKIVPFLVWYRVWSPQVGRGPVPTLAELSWRPGEATAYVLLALGFPALAVAVAHGDARWVQGAGLLVAAGAVFFTLALAHVYLRLGVSSRAPAAVPDRAS